MPARDGILRPCPYLTRIITSGILLSLIFADDRRRGRLWFPGLLGVFAALGVWLIQASPNPYIDVMSVQRAAITAAAQGTSPYSITVPNIYGGDMFYGPNLVKDPQVHFGLPYPPLSLLMAMPGQLVLGDLRYAELLALLVGCGAIGYASRGRIAPLAAALVLFTPRVFFVLEQAGPRRSLLLARHNRRSSSSAFAASCAWCSRHG